jgi:serine-type D-Ala-D-Ala carboxypeptidase
VYGAELKHPPGSAVAYTNINSLLLGEIVALLHGRPLEQALDDLVLAPLGLHETSFLPAPSLLARIAPTERDDGWRGSLVHGAVHDESAYALGGVAGHAGLFSTAADLHRFCDSWLARAGGTPALLRSETIALAVSNHTRGLNLGCGLGWMIDRANFMGAAPSGTYGHTGFTGPALVVVPGRRLVVVIVSNRVFPRRGPPHHHEVTASVVGAAM